MWTIHKYELLPGRTILHKIPKSSQILTCQMQGNKPMVWILLNTEEQAGPQNHKSVVIYGTGQEIIEPSSLKYINTFQMSSLVWHAFEEPD